MLIDLNADLGEGAGTDAELMPLITSANVCCGAHAGDAGSIVAALELAWKHGVNVGAHPGHFDREHFGRRERPITMEDVAALCTLQAGGLAVLAPLYGLKVAYIKPHGALYNQIMRDKSLARGLAGAAHGLGKLPVVGLPGSVAEEVSLAISLHFIPEGFADRRYRPDGSLVPRGEPDAIIHDPKEAVDQVDWLIREKRVRTICVHGDTPGAVEFVTAVRGFLRDRGHEVKAFA